MEINQQTKDLNFQDEQVIRASSFLKTLTTLTFIGCAIAIISSIYNFFTVCSKIKDLDKIENMANQQSGFIGKFLNSSIEITTSSCDNKVVLLILGLICTALCLYGAMLMRNLKSKGFPIYAIGELGLPILTSIILTKSVTMILFLTFTSLIIPIVFVVLYATKRKFMFE